MEIFNTLLAFVSLISTAMGITDSVKMVPPGCHAYANPWIGGVSGPCECYDDGYGVDRKYMINAISNTCLYFSNYEFSSFNTTDATYAMGATYAYYYSVTDDDEEGIITVYLGYCECTEGQKSRLRSETSAHHSATFLPWHRYFLHMYETTLRDKCGYDSGLVYWDWTLDCDAIENSPVFDPDTGFGGDGEEGAEITVSNTGRCVVDGPFAGITAEYYDVKYLPHCLSRGFRDLDGSIGHIDGSDITPESIEEVLSLDDYEKFVALMESRVHDAIPYGISGDFETFTAPYDPLFFLHHTQLDRLWWLWQKRQPGRGLTAYSGPKQRHSIEMASLDDLIQMQGLAEPVKVAEVMNIQGDLLCYDY